ncbi:L,D-transpeptidase [Geotalea daltonii]|uniref:L,D-transpeptidase n=1 Tax=Geotalea daltonii TaxID=1203471 RepID=UPI000A2EFC09|nr:L,D-transpeptidase [Geotalea daltonii]
MKKLLLAFIAIIIASVAVIWIFGKPESKPLAAGVVADRILIEKGPRRLTLFRQGKPLKSYEVALGRNPQGKKTEEGNCRTPEGIYTIDSKFSLLRFPQGWGFFIGKIQKISVQRLCAMRTQENRKCLFRAMSSISSA